MQKIKIKKLLRIKSWKKKQNNVFVALMSTAAIHQGDTIKNNNLMMNILEFQRTVAKMSWQNHHSCWKEKEKDHKVVLQIFASTSFIEKRVYEWDMRKVVRSIVRLNPTSLLRPLARVLPTQPALMTWRSSGRTYYLKMHLRRRKISAHFCVFSCSLNLRTFAPRLYFAPSGVHRLQNEETRSKIDLWCEFSCSRISRLWWKELLLRWNI